jgi:hypothetical protein
MQFVIEEICERGIRALTIAENIDTNDPAWERLAEITLLVSNIQIEANPFFVRMGQAAIFKDGFQVGACSLGYRPVAVPGAGVTKMGRPKTRPEVVPEVAALIVKHFELIAGGVTLSEGCRLWNREIAAWPPELRKLAVDPRTQTGRMRPEAYRRIFTRKKYLGIWEHGRKRNRWMNSKDGIIQIDAPENEVAITMREDLRMVSDELFHRVQQKLAEGTRGRHGPRSGKEPSLSDSLISLFHCSECGHVFHYYGRKYAHCPESSKGGCANWGTIEREKAVSAIIPALREQVLASRTLVDEIVNQSREVDTGEDGGDLAERAAILEKSIKRQTNLMAQLEQTCADDGMDADERNRHKAAKVEKTRLQAELASLRARSARKREPITEGEVLAILDEFDALLADAGAGKLAGGDKQRAAILVRDLTGGRVDVSFTRLAGRRAFGVGKFSPNPFLALAKRDEMTIESSQPLPEITVAFRELPRYARIAGEVYRLHVEEGLSFPEIGKRFDCGTGNAWGAYAYWHTSRGLPVPYKRAGVAARHRKSAS